MYPPADKNIPYNILLHPICVTFLANFDELFNLVYMEHFIHKRNSKWVTSGTLGNKNLFKYKEVFEINVNKVNQLFVSRLLYICSYIKMKPI